MSCIKRMGSRYGTNLVTDVLKGSNSSKIQSLGFHTLSTYGMLKEYSKDTIKELISFLIAGGYIICIGKQYPVLVLDTKANDVLFGTKTITMKRKIEKEASTKETSFSNLPFDSTLFEHLRALRKKLAFANHVPPFVVFSDATLTQMATLYPTTKDDLLAISGVGSVKFERYGKEFMSCISNYLKEKTM